MLNDLIDLFNELVANPCEEKLEYLLFKIEWTLKRKVNVGSEKFFEWQIELVEELKHLIGVEFEELMRNYDI